MASSSHTAYLSHQTILGLLPWVTVSHHVHHTPKPPSACPRSPSWTCLEGFPSTLLLSTQQSESPRHQSLMLLRSQLPAPSISSQEPKLETRHGLRALHLTLPVKAPQLASVSSALVLRCCCDKNVQTKSNFGEELYVAYIPLTFRVTAHH